MFATVKQNTDSGQDDYNIKEHSSHFRFTFAVAFCQYTLMCQDQVT